MPSAPAPRACAARPAERWSSGCRRPKRLCPHRGRVVEDRAHPPQQPDHGQLPDEPCPERHERRGADPRGRGRGTERPEAPTRRSRSRPPVRQVHVGDDGPASRPSSFRHDGLHALTGLDRPSNLTSGSTRRTRRSLIDSLPNRRPHSPSRRRLRPRRRRCPVAEGRPDCRCGSSPGRPCARDAVAGAGHRYPDEYRLHRWRTRTGSRS